MKSFQELAGCRFVAALLGTALSVHAQVMWQTTHTTIGGFNNGAVELSNASMKVKIHQAYLDVEEDVEIGTFGSVDPGNDPKSLEITGTFTLPAGSAITGALLWDGGKILQGKLLDRNIADSIYEAHVDRDSLPPPRPRDPLLLELVGKDIYRFKVYPVDLGKSRHFRLRYQLPPVIGASGMQLPLKAAIASLFPQSKVQIPVSLENGGGVGKVIFASGSGMRTEMTLPRTRLMPVSELSGQLYNWDPWVGSHTLSAGTVIHPVDPVRQMAVKTSMAEGQMAGHYLNLFAGVTDEMVAGLGARVEIVFYWKWNNPGGWITRDPWGGENLQFIWEAQNQGAALHQLYGQLGGPGSKVGLLHDDSKSAPRAFAAASRGDSAHSQGLDYLRHIQGAYVDEFARSLRSSNSGKAKDMEAAILKSRGRFLESLRIAKTLYSPETNTIRHLILVSVGPEYQSDNTGGNADFDSVFADAPVTIGTLDGMGFNQAGFDLWEARRTRTYTGAQANTQWGTLPGVQALNLNVVVRNERMAYDFSVKCEGGLAMSCGSLTFHGKSDVAWSDSLEWEAYDVSGKLLGRTTSMPKVIENAEDTAIAVLWAGSSAPFSEKREAPLGPVYGFVDRWASLLSLPADSLRGDAAEAYADSGVPRIANHTLKDVLPNFEDGQVSNPDNPKDPPTTVGLHARLGALADPSQWRLERSRGSLRIRIPGLAAGLSAEVEMFDLAGKRAGSWSPRSLEGSLNLASVAARPGVYVLKIRIAGLQAVKRVAL